MNEFNLNENFQVGETMAQSDTVCNLDSKGSNINIILWVNKTRRQN